MNKLFNLLKNKTVLIVTGLSVLILIIIIILSPKQTASPTPTPTPNYDAERTELIDLSQEKRQQAMIYVESIETKLPLYLESFPTSVGLDTSINIYRLKDDPAEVVRLEIYGLSYLNQESDPSKNPNVTAFKESYLKAIEMLEGQNIDPKRLIFIYGDKEYVRTTTISWINALKLEP
jgi:hypothetical protein